jgi:hypothetical protein
MPFFLIVAAWIPCIAVGLLCLAIRRLRFVSLYLLLGSSFAVLLAFILSTAVLFLLPRVGQSNVGAFAVLGGYLLMIGIGGFLGGLLGLLAAWRCNKRIGWSVHDLVG